MQDSWEYEYEERNDPDGNLRAPALPPFLADPVGALRRRWVWLTLAFALGLVGTGLVARSIEPIYVAKTTILVSSQVIPEDFVRTTVSEDAFAHMNAIIGQVMSRKHLRGLIERFDLYPELRDHQPLASTIDRMRSHIDIAVADSYKLWRRNTSSSQIMEITFGYNDPEIAAKVADELAGFFTAANIEMRLRQARLATDFLRREANRAEEELREQSRLVTQFLQDNRGGLPGELGANLAKLERLQAQRQSLATQIDAAADRLLALEAAPEDFTGPTPQSLRYELARRLEEQLVVLTEEHPNVIALQRRIERLEADIANQAEAPLSNTARTIRIAAAQRQLDHLREQERATETTISRLDKHVEGTPRRQEELSALEERSSVLRENYLEFLRKVQEAELAQSLESAQHGARVSVLDPAAAPENPKIRNSKIIAAGVCASVLFALGIGVLLELLDAVVIGAHHLQSIAEIRMLGSVPRIG